MVNRLVEPTSGRILLGDEDVLAMDTVTLRRRIGYVIQQVGLFPHQTVASNVATVPSLLGWDRTRSRERVTELLALVGLDPEVYGPRYPRELSGGQQQRVGVARALAADPELLLMDEPFGAVDPLARDRLQGEFRRIHDELGTTVLFVTHDIDEAVRLADRIAVLSTGGLLEQYAAPAEILAAPASERVADFVGNDRSIRLMSVTPVRREDLEPLPTGEPLDGASRIPLGASLREAFVRLVAESQHVVVVDPADGDRPVGLLTAESLHVALRRGVGDVDR